MRTLLTFKRRVSKRKREAVFVGLAKLFPRAWLRAEGIVVQTRQQDCRILWLYLACKLFAEIKGEK